MLILTRQVGETIYIGDNIAITVTALNLAAGAANEVRLGIVAPREVRVDRKEIYEARARNRAGGKP